MNKYLFFLAKLEHMKYSFKAITLLSIFLFSCTEAELRTPPIKFQNKGHELVYKMVKKVGSYEELLKKKDVTYTYIYQTPDKKTDISTEKYIFDGEVSYAKYRKHERTLSELEGTIEQYYDEDGYWIKQDGEKLTDKKYLKQVAFNRPTNFYWFTMMQKLTDPGLVYEHLGEKTIGENNYDIVKISFKSESESPTDVYQIYINQKTSLIDQFLFTVVDFGVIETPFLMKMEYEKIDGMLIPSKRKYKKSTWEAEETEGPWIHVLWVDIEFNTGIKKEDLKLKNKNMNNNSLKAKLDERKANFELKASDSKKKAYKEGLASVENSNIVNTAKQVGDKAPNFKLTNAVGEAVTLEQYLKKGKVVLTWYRGGWCPYCNLTLHELQQELPNFKLNNASLIALTPELPDESVSTAEKHNLEFEVLSDIGNKVAQKYGIVFKLTKEVAELYNQGFKLNSHNGDNSNELPLAATFIIDQNGEIIYAFLDADYRNRAEPSELTNFLENNK